MRQQFWTLASGLHISSCPRKAASTERRNYMAPKKSKKGLKKAKKLEATKPLQRR